MIISYKPFVGFKSVPNAKANDIPMVPAGYVLYLYVKNQPKMHICSGDETHKKTKEELLKIYFDVSDAVRCKIV
jgi:hypothetical protein